MTRRRSWAPMLLLLLVLPSCYQVDTNERCVAVKFGEVIDEDVPVGLRSSFLVDPFCFPSTDQNFPSDEESAIRFTVQTSDPVTLSAEVGVVWSYDPGTPVGDIYRQKGRHGSVVVEVNNAIRDGFRSAVAGWSIDQVFSERQAFLADSVLGHTQSNVQLPDGRPLAIIKRVFISDIEAPAEIEQARIRAAQMEQELAAQRLQFQVDSVSQEAVLFEAQVSAERQRLEGAAYATNPSLLRLREAEALAGGLANACSNSATCIIGGNVVDLFLARGGG